MNNVTSRRVALILGSAAFVLLLAIFLPRKQPINGGDSANSVSPGRIIGPGSTQPLRSFRRAASAATAIQPTAEEIVADKVAQFARSRRQLAHDLAAHFKVPVADDFERFFDAAEAGRYEEMTALYRTMREQRENGTGSPDYGPQWRTIIETQGAADAAHNWPAQKLLDYGNAILDSLRPGMVYVGGTDPGCFIPTLLNETQAGERHVVLTQNALADGTYLDYLSFLYGDRMAMPTKDDSQRAFQEYIADAQKRLQHDQQFPEEPKQIRPGEDVRVTDGRVQVSGQVAVMAINEKLFQTFMQHNPDAAFAMEESFPFKSTFAGASSLGPVMELRVQDEHNVLTQERAAQAVDYWRATAGQLSADPETPDGSDPRKAWSKLASSQAGLLLERGFAAEAEQAFRLANEMAPTSPEAVYRYVNLLVEQKRVGEAIPVVENALRIEPKNDQFRNLAAELKRLNRN
jgi:tetratricopeptide (TPR) repeat protein